jgi:hypothetical protein
MSKANTWYPLNEQELVEAAKKVLPSRTIDLLVILYH